MARVWMMTWTLHYRNVLEGLTATVQGQAELAGHFPPRPVVLHALDLALAQAGVHPSEVTALVVTIEQTEATP